MPIEVQRYDERQQEMIYTLTPSSEEGAPVYSLIVQQLPDTRGKMRLLLHRGTDRVDPANQEVAESDHIDLTAKKARAEFYKEVVKTFPDENMGWVEEALKYLSIEHRNFLEKEVKKVTEDRTDYILLKGHKPPLYHTPHGYRIEGEHSAALIPLSNFTARILEDVEVLEGGGYKRRCFQVEATRDKRKKVFEVPAPQFDSLRWVANELGALAYVEGSRAKGTVAKAIRLESAKKIKEITAYGHTGWISLEDGRWCYLHSKGAIVERGTKPFSGRVVLEDKLGRRTFPKGSSEEIREAVRVTFDLWDLLPDKISIPTMATVYRCVMGDVHFSVHLAGQTGMGKSTFADLATGFFGTNLGENDREDYGTTRNTIEKLAFLLKDQVLVVDDYRPDQDKAHERTLNSIGRVAANKVGRGRLTSARKISPGQPPRGLILSTGESLPAGESLNARILSLRFRPGVSLFGENRPKLDAAQAASKQGVLALAMGAFVESLAPDYGELRANLESRRNRYGYEVSELVSHTRTPAIYGDLKLGIEAWLGFAEDVGAITESERTAYQERADQAVLAAILDQGYLLGPPDKVSQLRALLKTAVMEGKAHVSIPGEELREESNLLGWEFPGEGLFLIPDQVLKVAKETAQKSDELYIPSKEETHQRLLNSPWLLSHDNHKKRKSIPTRKRIAGEEKTVLHLKPGFLDIR